MRLPSRIVRIVIILLVLGTAYFLYSTNRLPFITHAAEADVNTASGFIEGRTVNVVTEIGGRIAAIEVDEGDRVTAGQEVIRLDHTLLDAQIAQAQAAVNTAQAQLKQVQSPPRASDIAAAQAALAAAQQNIAKVRGGPTLDQLIQLKAQVDNAKAALDQSQAVYDRIGGASNPLIGMTPQSLALQQASNNYMAAVSAYNEARTHPTASELAAAQAQVEQAQAALDRLTPTQESIAVAQDQVKQAEAALAVLQAQVAKMTLVSPVTGVVSNRALQTGELATPGTALLTVTQFAPVTLTIYVPETKLGRIRLGQPVAFQVDSFPGRNFTGRIIFIDSRAQFTPRNVQTKEERVNAVLAVKIELPNERQELKPGMPADATIE